MNKELHKELWSCKKPCDVCGREPYNDGITRRPTTQIAYHVICIACLHRGISWMKSIGKYFIVDIPNEEKWAKKFSGKGEEE